MGGGGILEGDIRGLVKLCFLILLFWDKHNERSDQSRFDEVLSFSAIFAYTVAGPVELSHIRNAPSLGDIFTASAFHKDAVQDPISVHFCMHLKHHST